MALWGRALAHGGHFWAHVGAIMARSGALERHHGSKWCFGAPLGGPRCPKCPLFRGRGRSMLVSGEGLWQGRGSAEGGEASPPSYAKDF